MTIKARIKALRHGRAAKVAARAGSFGRRNARHLLVLGMAFVGLEAALPIFGERVPLPWWGRSALYVVVSGGSFGAKMLLAKLYGDDD